jgi:hypothetical protein
MSEEGPITAAARLWPAQDATGFTYFDFLYACGSPLEALFYSELFWPRFVEVDDMVFLESSVEDESDRLRVREALYHYGGDRERTEKSFNTVEVGELFGKRAGEVTPGEEEALARRLCIFWSARLRESFPQRQFCVELLPADETAEVAVCFYQRAAER